MSFENFGVNQDAGITGSAKAAQPLGTLSELNRLTVGSFYKGMRPPPYVANRNGSLLDANHNDILSGLEHNSRNSPLPRGMGTQSAHHNQNAINTACKVAVDQVRLENENEFVARD